MFICQHLTRNNFFFPNLGSHLLLSHCKHQELMDDKLINKHRVIFIIPKCVPFVPIKIEYTVVFYEKLHYWFCLVLLIWNIKALLPACTEIISHTTFYTEFIHNIRTQIQRKETIFLTVSHTFQAYLHCHRSQQTEPHCCFQSNIPRSSKSKHICAQKN